VTGLLKVTEEMVGVHPIHPEYPLLPGDVLTLDPDGTYTKHTGLCVLGFTLSPEQVATLKPIEGTIAIGGCL
jgi:hypothetical protein